MAFQTMRLAGLRLGLAAAALVAIAGCAAAAGHTAAPPPGHIYSGPSIAENRIAHDAVLHHSDFPAGWASSPRPVPITSSNCAGLDHRKPGFTAHVVSPEFTHSDIRTATSTAFLYATTPQATRAFIRLSSHATLVCLARVVHRGVEATARAQGVKVSAVRTSRLSSPPLGVVIGRLPAGRAGGQRAGPGQAGRAFGQRAGPAVRPAAATRFRSGR